MCVCVCQGRLQRFLLPRLSNFHCHPHFFLITEPEACVFFFFLYNSISSFQKAKKESYGTRKTNSTVFSWTHTRLVFSQVLCLKLWTYGLCPLGKGAQICTVGQWLGSGPEAPVSSHVGLSIGELPKGSQWMVLFNTAAPPTETSQAASKRNNLLFYLYFWSPCYSDFTFTLIQNYLTFHFYLRNASTCIKIFMLKKNQWNLKLGCNNSKIMNAM